ncbi:MAG: SET domain-containing protein-lysine N-methyltransferase [Caulobacteraceae bacterium]
MTDLFIRQEVRRVAVYAARPYRSGQTVLKFEPIVWRNGRNRETVEHPSGGHIYHPMLARVTHSCAPNCRVSFVHRALIAVRDIGPGEAVTFDYRTTENRLAGPFQCRCGSPSCVGRVA